MKPAAAIVKRLLTHVRDGQIVLVENGVEHRFGQPSADQLAARVVVHDGRFYGRLLRGSLGLGQAYADGLWDGGDGESLVRLLRVAARNMHRFDRLRRSMRPVSAPLQFVLETARRNTRRRARRQIAAHYDLGNDLYELFLDETMTYSAAIFHTQGISLREAQQTKLDRICRKLDLQPGDRLLEIGSGWGSLALHAARHYDAEVTTATISLEQHRAVLQRVREAGLEHHITVLLDDYRNLVGTYDKLVSVEMIEAVGWRNFPTFFRLCAARLAEDGAMLLQAITIDDRAYEVEKATRTFIKDNVFPGGCLPSVRNLVKTMARNSDMRIVHLEDITRHYVTTLQHWRARFDGATEALERRGYDERFRRRWELYLAYCEAGFAERRIQDVQMLLVRPGFRREPLCEPPKTASEARRASPALAVVGVDADDRP